MGVLVLPPSCRASAKFALLPPTQTLSLENIHVINFTLTTPFNLTLTPMEQSIVVKFQNDSLYQNLLSFNSQPVPLTSLNSELGQLREIEQARKDATTWSQASSYVSISISVCFAVAICTVLTCWYLLRENRTRTGQVSQSRGFLRLFSPRESNAYRGQTMSLQEQTPLDA